MKKILIINTLYFPNVGGGAELRIQERAEGLQKLGHDVIVLATTNKSGLNFDFVNNIKVYRAEIKNRYWHFDQKSHSPFDRILWHYNDRYNRGMSKYVEQVIEIEKPDVVICHNLSGWSIAVWDVIKRHKLPLVQFLHDYYLLCPSSTMFNEKNLKQDQTIVSKLFRLGFAKKSNKVDIVVGVSQFIVNKLNQYEYFKSSKKLASYNQRSIGDNPVILWDSIRPLNIGFIGTLCEAKGIRLLIQAFKKLTINAKLLIAGTGNQEYIELLKKLAESDSRIIFLGHSKPSEFYPQIDLLVIPSLWNDTLPGVAIESCAYNVPIIGTNLGGLPEVVKDGLNGKLIEPLLTSLIGAIMDYYNSAETLNQQKLSCRNLISNTFLNQRKMLNDYSVLIEEL